MQADRFSVSGCVAACPGCAYRDLDYPVGIARKADWLQRALVPWAGQLAPVAEAAPADRCGYRDRACLAAGWDGVWQIGLTRRDRVVAIPDCPVHSPRLRGVVGLLTALLPPPARFPLVWLVQSGAQLTLVVKCAERPRLEWFTDAVASQLEAVGVEGVWLHLFPSTGRKQVLHKREWQLLRGVPRSYDHDGLTHGPAAFQQLVPALSRQARDEAAFFLAPRPGDRVLDLYCGGGGTLARWSAAGAETLGVELAGEAVACAGVNAPEATVLRGTGEARLPQMGNWLESVPPARRKCYVNPPRTGIEPAVLTWLVERARPERIAYLSCSAGTLRRDLVRLTGAGYQVTRITPYDFFPWTHHVEILALLRRM